MAAYLSRIGYSVADLDRLNIVHVAGTKGKGSTCAFVASILLQHFRGRQRAGGSSSVTPMHVGLFTSPHLVAVRERIRVDGIPLSEDDFARYFFEVWDRLDAWQPSTPPSVAATPSSVAASQASVVDTSSTVSTQTPPMATPTSVATNGETEVVDMEPPPGSKPTYARFLTLLSWHVYLSIASSTPSTSTSTVVASNHNHPLASNIVCVYETGIGGEYDSTNLPRRPLATGISSLGIDHVATLGATLPEIAWHKAGIMKAGSPAFTVQQPEEAMAVLRQRADELGGTSASVHLQVVDGDSGILSGVHIRPDASFQRKNAALAVALADAALKQLDPGYEGLPADGADGTSQLPRAFIDGLEQVKWRGRCEVKVDVARPNVVWHLDGAHTADSLRMAGRWFGEECARRESGNSGDVSTIRALVFNQQGRPEAATIFLERLFKAVKSKGPDGRRPFDVVVFCTNVTYATGYKKGEFR